MQITNWVWRRLDPVLAVCEEFHTLALGEFQEHQFRAVIFFLRVKNFSRAEGISIPADTPLYIGDFESHVAKANSSDPHVHAPFRFLDCVIHAANNQRSASAPALNKPVAVPLSNLFS